MDEMKKEKAGTSKSINLLWIGIFFSACYWILESVRDVLSFEKGNIFERIFTPDPMSFWIRFLVVCIFILSSVQAQSLKEKMKEAKKRPSRTEGMIGIIQVGFGFGALYWILESFRDSFIFGKGSLFEQIFTPDPMGLWMRLLAIFILLLFSIYVQALLDARRKIEEELREKQEELERNVRDRTAELSESNRLLEKEIVGRKRVEEEIRRVNRALKTLSESNMALARATEESALLGDVCNILVDVGGYPMAWVGYAEQDEESRVCPVSKAGDDGGYLEAVNFSWMENKKDHNPAGMAIRTRKPCIVKNIMDESDDIPWRCEAAKRGFVSSVSFPLLSEDVVFGSLSIYSTDEDAFDPEETKLLDELASDLAFGIKLLRARDAHKRAEEEKERMQVQLIQAQKMEAVGILAGGIAHDFNNMLTAIQVSIDLVMMEVDEEDVFYKDLKEVINYTKRASDLLRQLLLFSRRHHMEYAVLDFNRLVDELGRMLHRLIGEDIEINTDLESDLWTVRADRGTMEQVIMNLAVNARDAMPNGGQIVLKTENVVLDEEQCKDMPEARLGRFVHLSFSDTGIGMDENVAQHVFEPFFTTKGNGEGTGLGLSVIYGIVKQHDGWIGVRSKIGHGSSFEIYLPAVDEETLEQTEKMVSLDQLQGEGKRILLVEDEEKVRKFTTRALSRNGYVVFPAANGKEAADVFKRENGNFNLVLSDVVLPDQSGLELVDTFLSCKPNLQVMLSSGYTDHKSQWPVIQKRGYRFLEKPYTLGNLLSVIRDIFGSAPA